MFEDERDPGRIGYGLLGRENEAEREEVVDVAEGRRG